jgi:glutathione S-transferase
MILPLGSLRQAGYASPMTELLGLVYSPWTEKARWALDVRRVPYVWRSFEPLIGEPALRWKLRRLRGRVSVPVLTTDEGRVIEDSAAIARWADGHGDGPTLFPAEHEAAIARYVDLSERALAAGRTLSLERILADDDALTELVPRPLRQSLGGAAKAIGAFGVRRTMRKYEIGERDPEALRATIAGALDEVRERLSQNAAGAEPRTILGRFTFADIAMQMVLVNVQPPADLKLGAANRRSFADPTLRDRYGDLLAWRDELARVYRARTRS